MNWFRIKFWTVPIVWYMYKSCFLIRSFLSSWAHAVFDLFTVTNLVLLYGKQKIWQVALFQILENSALIFNNKIALWFTSYLIVIIFEDNSEHVAYTRKKIGLFGEKFRFVAALVLIKCLKHINWQRLLLTCAPISV